MTEGAILVSYRLYWTMGIEKRKYSKTNRRVKTNSCPFCGTPIEEHHSLADHLPNCDEC